MQNGKTWLLLADASKARIYAFHKARVFKEKNHKCLELVGQFTHAESRMKAAELVSDKSGEFGAGTFVESTAPKLREAEQFAHELIDVLEKGRTDNTFKELILVAPPAFMGLLNKFMPHEMKKLISKTIEKDYTQYNDQELIKNLINYL